MDGCNTSFLLGSPIFRRYVSCRYEYCAVAPDAEGGGVGWVRLQSVDTQNMFCFRKNLIRKVSELDCDGFQFLYCTSQIGNSDCINHLNLGE